ncbi:response regulator [Candidatus Magnetomonas plexicatena]|uniref:response regulator n=1 Tax=Candidatus Magnetomonas plexicatena TaxID=2552947 RepID=UPI001103C4F0|nr:response regulator transcription factor [Nitrospirales bacterium LBB_01]
MRKIIVIEDEKDIAELLSYNLKKAGFSVTICYNGSEGLKTILNGFFDLVILDLMLPGTTGMEICKRVKASKRTASIPIIMLTAKSGESDKVAGLESGADDYLTKPFSIRELMARIKAVLRRTADDDTTEKIIKTGNLLIDMETYTVTKSGKLLSLSPTEFKLLVYLIKKRGKVQTRDMLLDAVWRDEAFVEPRTVDVHIRRLRAQIEDKSDRPAYIKTRRGVGYYFDDTI